MNLHGSCGVQTISDVIVLLNLVLGLRLELRGTGLKCLVSVGNLASLPIRRFLHHCRHHFGPSGIFCYLIVKLSPDKRMWHSVDPNARAGARIDLGS